MYLQLGRPAIRGNFLVDITVRAAQDGLGNHYQGRREEIVPFFASLNRTMYYTLCGVAERVGLAHTEPRRLLTNPDFWNEFTAKAVDLVFGAALHGLFSPAALPADEMRDDFLGILDEFDRRHAHA